MKLRREMAVRIVLLVLVIFGSVVIPLGLETRWRHQDPKWASRNQRSRSSNVRRRT